MADDKNKDIKRAPTVSVQAFTKPKVTTTGKNIAVTASWKFPSVAFDKKRDDRYEGIVVDYVLDSSMSKNTITNTYKASAAISGIKAQDRKGLALKGKVSSAKWGTIARSDYYPCSGSKTEVQVKLYRLTKKPTYNSASKKWTIAKKGKKFFSWLPTYLIPKASPPCRPWSYYASLAVNSSTMKTNWKDIVFYLSTTQKSEIKKKTKKYVSKTTLDGIAVTVQPWNSVSMTNWNYREIKKPTGNPNANRYFYRNTDPKTAKKQKWKLATETKVKAGRTYYARDPTPVLAKGVPKAIAYFDFSPPANPSVSTSVGDEQASHVFKIKVKSAIDKTCAKERYDTKYVTYFQYGLQRGAVSTGKKVKVKSRSIEINQYRYGFIKSPARKLNDYSKTDTRADIPNISINPNTISTTWMKKSITGLKEGEWLQIDFYCYNRGIAGNSVGKPGVSTEPALKDMRHASCLYAWPYEPQIFSVAREGQHYRISFRVVGLAENEKRATARYVLQRLANFRPDADNLNSWSANQWNAAAAASSDWKDVAVAGASERAFSDNVRDAAFEPTKRTYYRIRSEGRIDGIAHLYSEPVVVPGYSSVSKVSKDPCDIIEACSCYDGNAIRVVVAFTRTVYDYEYVVDPPSNPGASGLYEYNSDTKTYTMTQDTYVINEKNYYEKSDTPVLDSNGTELSWSEFPYGWVSSDTPSTLEIHDVDDAPKSLSDAINGTGSTNWKVSEKRKKDFKWVESVETTENGKKKIVEKPYKGYQHYHTFYVVGLKKGTEYFFRARRFIDDSSMTANKEFSKYGEYKAPGASSATPVIAKSKPKKVKMSAPSVLLYGSDIELGWTYDEIDWSSNAAFDNEPQEAYEIYYMLDEPKIEVGSNGSIISNAGSKAQLLTKANESGEVKSAYNNATIGFVEYGLGDKLRSVADSTKNSMQHIIYLAVKVKVGGVWSSLSNTAAVVFVDGPIANLELKDESKKITSLPFEVNLRTNDVSSEAIVRIKNSGGHYTWTPTGKEWEPDGTIVYSEKFKPSWQGSGDANTATPYVYTWTSENKDILLKDGGKYEIEYIASTTYDNLGLNESFELYDEEYARTLIPNGNRFNDNADYEETTPYWWSKAMSFDYSTDSYTFDSAKYDKYGTRRGVSAIFDVDIRNPLSLPTYSGSGGYSSEYCINPPSLNEDGSVTFRIPKRISSAMRHDSDDPDLYHESTDVIDLYRVTPDGAYLVKTDIDFSDDEETHYVIDTLPMYSNCSACKYRLAVRTAEGAVNWTDVSCGKYGYAIRFDWGDESDERHGVYTHLELPYNLKWTDQWSKQSRIQLHMDGSYSGYWRGGVEHKNSMSTEIVKFEEIEQIERVRALAKHSGPVYVRLPDGCAFCANVEVSNLDTSYDSLTQTVSFSAQEIKMAPSYSTDAVIIRTEKTSG